MVRISLAGIVLCVMAATAFGQRPNVLLIVGDDHMYEAMGCAGSKIARTPHLDQLAADGIRFERAYCQAPICAPSRQSFLTGRYPHTTGVSLLTQALDDEKTITLAERLREVGYRTGAFGKMHFNSAAQHGFEELWDISDWHVQDAERSHRPLPPGMEVLPPWKPFKDHARVWLNSFYRPFGRYDDEMPGTCFANKAIEFMKAHREEPFFVQIGFLEPHSPYTFPVDFPQPYDPTQLPVPTPGPEDGGQIPKIFADLTLAEKQGIIASYHTSAAFLDANVGRVLAGLDELKLADNTLVIYLGDNGYHLGHHGRFEKHCFYERAVRVPLMMRYPGRIKPASTTPALVEFVDVVPTVLDYLSVAYDAGAAPPRDLHGRSLRPLIEGRTDKLRDTAFSEYQHTEEAMVCTERYKLIYRTARAVVDWYEPVEKPQGRSVRLYDLKEDPEEMHNVAADPSLKAVVEDLRDRLADVYRRTPIPGETLPDNLSREDFLDWAIAPRNVPETKR